MQITPALNSKLGYGTCADATTASSGTSTSKSIVCRKRRNVHLRRRSLRCREGYLSLSGCLVRHRPVLRADRASARRSDAHDVRNQPHPEARRPPRLDHAQLGSLRAIPAILQGYHPAFFPAYIRPRKEGEDAEARHNREYAPHEVQHLLTDSGFERGASRNRRVPREPHPEFGWVNHMLERYKLHQNYRGDGIYALGRKTGPVKERWPEWLYS